MKNKRQIDKVVAMLLNNGVVTRNWALNNYISRLGAIIYDLKQLGWEFKGEYFKNGISKDYRYILIKKGSIK